jgi:hypothetical protein
METATTLSALEETGEESLARRSASHEDSEDDPAKRRTDLFHLLTD